MTSPPCAPVEPNNLSTHGSRLIYDYIQKNPRGAVGETIDSYFSMAEIKLDRPWPNDILGSTEKIGQVSVSTYNELKVQGGSDGFS